MSNKALNWAWEAPIPAGPKLVLVALADHATDHAGEDWTCFPGIERLLSFTSLPPRTLERHVAWLVKEGWISRETPRAGGKMQKRHYTLHRARLAAAKAGPGAVDAEGSDAPPANMAGGDHPPKTPLTTRQNGGSPPANMAGGLYIAEPPIEPLEPEARARARDAFGSIKAVWPVEALDWTDVPRAEASFLGLVEEGVVPGDLVHAAKSAVAAGNWRKPPSLNRWLDERRWEGRLPGREPEPPQASEPVRPAVPREVLDAFAAAEGSTWTATYVQPAGWDETTRMLLPRTRVALERLRAAWPREAMAALGVRLGEVMRADLAQAG